MPPSLPWTERRRLDDLCRELVMLRAGAVILEPDPKAPRRKTWRGTCERCQRVQLLQWCHLFTRDAWRVRWDPDNSFAWCKGCHRYLDQHWDVKQDWVVERIGRKAYEALKLRKRTRGAVNYGATRIALETQLARLYSRAGQRGLHS